MSQFNRRDFLKGVAAGLGTAALPGALFAQQDATSKPNILLVMCDDMGFSDIGCYGGEVSTPNIDGLAKRGVRFTQAYNNAKCSPTRASLLTGQYPGYQGSGPRANLAAAMKEAGYSTYMTGKVHGHSLGGFDRSCTMGACASFWDLVHPKGKEFVPTPAKIDGQVRDTFLQDHPGFYATDCWTDYAVKYVTEHCATETSPFFLYVAYNAPHYPLHAPQDEIEKYRGKFMEGWDVLRERRRERLVDLGVVGPEMKMAPRDEDVPAWDSLADAEKKRWDLEMAVYAAMIDRMDQGIGRILKRISELGQEGNTLVFFLSDNGACAKASEIPPGSDPGPKGTWHMTGKGWADLSNTPFRKFKTWDHEGGISTPLICSWPERIRRPAFDRDLCHVSDITATCLDVAGRPNTGILGKSLAPAFFGRRRDLHDELCWAILKGKAARRGRWKAVRYADGPWHLYDMDADRAELNDLAAEHPDTLAALVDQWNRWDGEVRYIGEPNTREDDE